jgi:uncharacterized caspase-like protein
MRQWAIVVGLNHYQHFQPLSCAQQDAQNVHHYLIHELGFQSEHCLLLTDTSPPVWGKPTQPTRVNLLSWIELLTKHYLHPDDLVWFFFSGHGAVHEGQDYLVPGDGNPADIPSTCLAISTILNQLKAVVSNGTLMFLLDMSRSEQGISSRQGMGLQTAQVAHQLGVPTLLACQPGQFSHEVSGLGQGLFTMALLEGWHYQPGTTIAALTQFLGDRLPELSQHYWQPIQKPLLICPVEKLHHPLIPVATRKQDAANHAGSPLSATYPATSRQDDRTTAVPKSVTMAPPTVHSAAFNRQPASPTASTPAGAVPLSGQPTVLQSATTLNNPLHDFHPAPDSLAPTRPPVEETSQPPKPDPISRSPEPEKPLEESNPRQWRSVWMWGSLISLLLAAGVLGRNWASLGSASQLMASTGNSIGTGIASTTVPSPSVAPTQSPPETTPLPPSTAPSGQPSVAASPSPAEGPGSPAPVPSPTLSPSGTLDFSLSEAKPLSGQVILDRARKMVQSDQATPYRDAIDEARNVPPRDAVYPATKAAIQEWSQTIFDIAQRRASQQQIDIAILAADKVPDDNPQLYAQARTAIAQWCPSVKSLPGETPSQQKAKTICGF